MQKPDLWRACAVAALTSSLVLGCTSGAPNDVEAIEQARGAALLAEVGTTRWYDGDTWASFPGSTTYDPSTGQFNLTSQGHGLALALPDGVLNAADSVRFVYTPWSAGDVEIVVRLTAANYQPPAGPVIESIVQAGVMIREGNTGLNVAASGDLDNDDLMGAGWFNNGSPHNPAVCHPDMAGELSSFDESTRQPNGPDGTIVPSNGAGGTRVKPPVWLRLQRIGNDYSVSRRREGGPWIPLGGGRFTPTSEANVRVGFYVGGAWTAAPGEKRATFDNVTIGRPQLDYRTSWIASSHAAADVNGFVSNGMDAFYLAADGTSYKYFADAELGLAHSIDRFDVNGQPMRVKPNAFFGAIQGGITGFGSGSAARIYYFKTNDIRTVVNLVATDSDLSQAFWTSSLPTPQGPPTDRVGGVAADAGHVYVSDRQSGTNGRVRIFDAATGVEVQSIAFSALPPPGPLAVDRAGRLWVARTTDFPQPLTGNFNQNANSRIDCIDPFPGGAPCPPVVLSGLDNPTALAIAPVGTTLSDRLLVAMNGSQSQNVYVFTNLDSFPTKSEFGAAGGVFTSPIPGRVDPSTARFFSPIGVGSDANGNVWVASSAPRVEIQKFSPSGVALWSKPPLGYSPEPGAFDMETDGNDFYTLTRSFKLNIGDPAIRFAPGSEWVRYSVTWDPFRAAFAPMDQRFVRGLPHGGTLAPWIRRLPAGIMSGNRFMFWQQNPDVVRIYRFEPTNDIALPCGSIELHAVAGCPNGQACVKLWLDTDKNGSVSPLDVQQTAPRTAGFHVSVDQRGDIWLASRSDGIWKVPFQQVVDGVPRYDLTNRQTAIQATTEYQQLWSDLRSVRYDAQRNALFVLGFVPTGLQPICTGGTTTQVVARYGLNQSGPPTIFPLPDPVLGRGQADDFANLIWDPDCSCNAVSCTPPNPPPQNFPCAGTTGCDCDWPFRSLDIAGNYFFVQEWYGAVHVHHLDTGLEVARLSAGPELSGWQSATDYYDSLSVLRRANGEYLVTTTDTSRHSRTILFRWKPGGLGPYPETTFTTQSGADTYLVENDSTTHHTEDRIRARGDGSGTQPVQVGLVRWTLPTGGGTSLPCHVQSASITLSIRSTSNQSFRFYPATRSFTAQQANWTNAANGIAWQVPGAMGSADRGAAFQNFTPNVSGQMTIPLNAAGLALVQSWVSQPVDNKGIVVGHETHSDGFTFDSFENATTASRPKLTYVCN